ncbi:MAG: class II fructose-1,6-bisphosphate aldolase [candidate division Zixibacteria bacterium]|nr:class II fructose-1,6-bisphosphate aldolase [candidate division Zixibacteria bacterium]
MSLVSLNDVYADANRNYYAIGHFNISNLEFTQAVIEAAQEMNSPVIIGVSESGVKYAGAQNLVAMVKSLAEQVSVPVALHLDHGSSMEFVTECVDAGFTSVMIDGSHLPLEENIRITHEAVDYAHQRGVSVEAELGRLGGIEDNIKVDAKDAFLTDPDEAQRFVEESGVDALAVAVGTSHGAYKFKEEARLDFNRIATIKKRLGIPLVLHGASGVPQELTDKLTKYGGKIANAKGVPDEAYRKAIKNGINKINVDTDLRLAFTSTLRQILTEQPEIFDPRKILGPTREAIKDVVKNKIQIFGSASRVNTMSRKMSSTRPEVVS